MAHRRITIYDYPEHLNPFHDDCKIERKPDISKYGTWGSTSRSKIRKSITNSTWIEALNLSPAKKKVSKKWSFIKTQTVERIQRARSKSNPPDLRIKTSDQREVITIRPKRQFSERLVATSTPIKHELEVKSPVENIQSKHDEENRESLGAIPKMRKKRAAPRPPSAMLTPDTETWNWNTSDSVPFENRQFSDIEDIQVIEQERELADSNQTGYEQQEKEAENVHIKPLIEEPNIVTLVSNNLTM